MRVVEIETGGKSSSELQEISEFTTIPGASQGRIYKLELRVRAGLKHPVLRRWKLNDV